MGETAVIVNELGEVGTDHHLLRRVDERTVLLRSGCVCRTLRGGPRRRAARTAQPANVVRSGVSPCVVETTGPADLAPVVYTLLSEPVVRHQHALETVVATVDAVRGLRRAESVKQAATADTLVVTKVTSPRRLPS